MARVYNRTARRRLLELTNLGMLSYDATTSTYNVTQKGHNFIRIYRQTNEILEQGELA